MCPWFSSTCCFRFCFHALYMWLHVSFLRLADAILCTSCSAGFSVRLILHQERDGLDCCTHPPVGPSAKFLVGRARCQAGWHLTDHWRKSVLACVMLVAACMCEGFTCFLCFFRLCRNFLWKNQVKPSAVSKSIARATSFLSLHALAANIPRRNSLLPVFWSAFFRTCFAR